MKLGNHGKPFSRLIALTIYPLPRRTRTCHHNLQKSSKLEESPAADRRSRQWAWNRRGRSGRIRVRAVAGNNSPATYRCRSDRIPRSRTFFPAASFLFPGNIVRIFGQRLFGQRRFQTGNDSSYTRDLGGVRGDRPLSKADSRRDRRETGASAIGQADGRSNAVRRWAGDFRFAEGRLKPSAGRRPHPAAKTDRSTSAANGATGRGTIPSSTCNGD